MNWLQGFPCERPVWQGVTCSIVHPELAVPDPPPTPPPSVPDKPPPSAPPPPTLGPESIPEGRVLGLLLRGNSLIGTLPTEIGQIEYLSELKLYENQISGTVPASLGALAGLATVDISANRISGTMDGLLGLLPPPFTWQLDASPPPPPSLPPGGAPSPLPLAHLLLSDNNLSGTLPPSLGARSLLRLLHASRNPKLSGTLPRSLATGASTSGATTPRSSAIAGRQVLEALQLSETRLSGSLPSELGLLASLQHLLIDRASLHGTLPTQLGRCADLATLSLEHNSLSGSIPLELGGNCSRAFDFALETTLRPVPGTDLLDRLSSSTDGPRSLQHPLLPPPLRRTAASLRLRGNPALATAGLGVGATTLVDIADLSSHDLCAYARGLAIFEYSPSPDWLQTQAAEGGAAVETRTATLAGTIFRSPSYRATYMDRSARAEGS